MWRLAILPGALRELAALPANIRTRLDRRIQDLAHNPRPPGIKTLQGKSRGLLRLRVGDYRVIYRVDDQAREVTIIQVDHRRDVYRGR
jgi:mRNA interferase RelE/StbE